MIIKIINVIFIHPAIIITELINPKILKKTKKSVFTKRLVNLRCKYKYRKNLKRIYAFSVRRRWRHFFYRHRPMKTFIRLYIKRRLRRFKLKTMKKVRRLVDFTKLFLLIYYFKIIYSINVYLFLLQRFAVFNFKLNTKLRKQRYFTRGRYIFEQMLLKTFLNGKKKNLILTIGKKQYLPDNYNYYPLKVSVFGSVKKSTFYEKLKLSYESGPNHYLFLLKSFKKSNLFVKTLITNTDFFIKLNIKNYKYNLFTKSNSKKLTLPPKINITSRQISVLKQARLRIYNFYHKKSRNYKLTKFFLKLSGATNSINWLVNWEFKLINILLRSKISRSYKQSLELIFCGYVFVNGVINTNKNHIVIKGDLIQIPINTNWFLRDRVQTNFFNLFLKDLRKYVKKNRLFSDRYSLKFSRGERSWLVENLRNFSKTPVYMEVDYSTLSIIILKQAVNFDEVLPVYINTFKPITSRLYNWRYFY